MIFMPARWFFQIIAWILIIIVKAIIRVMLNIYIYMNAIIIILKFQLLLK